MFVKLINKLEHEASKLAFFEVRLSRLIELVFNGSELGSFKIVIEFEFELGSARLILKCSSWVGLSISEIFIRNSELPPRW